MSEISQASKVVTVDEALAALSTIARDESAGGDRIRALNLLMKMSSTETALPPPLGEGELIDRLIRILRGVGKRRSRIAYMRAFPRRAQGPEDNLTVDEAGIDTSKLPRSLKLFYRRYPEVKRPGFPKGYPVAKGLFEQQEWIKRASIKLELDRIQAKQIDALMELEAPTDGTDDKTTPPEPAPTGD